MTVDIMGALAVGTYDLITSASLVGTAVVGVNNTGNAAYLEYDTVTNTLKLIVAVAGFDIAVVDNITTESSGTGSFTIVMKSQPSANTTIDLSSSNTGEGNVQAFVSFTPANWDVVQTIVITGVDDPSPVGDGSVPYNIVTGNVSSSDTIYNAFDGTTIADITMENENNDPPAISVRVVDSEADESGATARLQFELLSLPFTAGADVTIPLSVSDTSEGSIAVSSITILNANWDNPSANEVTITGVDDLLADGTIVYTIVTGDPTSTDPGYGALTASDISNPSISNIDNDIPGFTIVELDGDTEIDETGTTDSFTVVLDAQPVSDVVLDIASGDITEGTISVSQLTFTNSNWDTPQNITVTGEDDITVDGNVSYDISMIVNASSDLNYLSVGGQAVTVTTTDDEMVSFLVSPITLAVTENGGTNTFAVELGAQPSSDVIFDISSSMADAIVSPTTLTFTNDDWDTPQNITVTGVADSDSLLNTAVTVSVAVNQVSSNSDFHSLADQTVSVSVTDVDDIDDDGSSNLIEDAGFNNGDGDGNGTLDSQEQNVSAAPNPVTGEYTTLKSTGVNCSFVTENEFIGESVLAASDPTADYPVGLVDFQLECANPGESADIVIYYTQEYDVSAWQYKKYNSVTGNVYSNITDLVTFGTHTYATGPEAGNTVTTVSYTVTDGDARTDEDIGAADGIINDPSGPAIATVTTSGG